MSVSAATPPAVRAPACRFAAVVIAAGAGVLASVAAGGDVAAYARPSATLIALTLLTLVAEHVTLKLPHERDDVTVTAGRLFAFSLLLTAGTGPAVAAWAVAVLISDAARRRSPLKAAFNAGQYAVSLAAAGLVLGAASGGGGFEAGALSTADAPAILLAGGTLWFLNHLLAATVSALAMGVSLRTWVRREPATVLLVDAMLLAFAPVVVLVGAHGAGLLPLIGIPVAALYLSAREAERRQRDSLHDALTGLPNRAGFVRAVERALSEAREGGPPAAVLLLDIDRFKEINDALGHGAGDLVLQQLARRLGAVARDGDVVARFGGDEFACLVRGARDDEALRAIAHAFRAAFEDPVLASGVQITTGASVGIAQGEGDGAGDLMRRADVALYAAKADGGVAAYDPAHDPHGPARLERMTELRQGIPRGELVVFYQPQLSLDDGRVTGAEALVRWQHPTEGLLPPGEFIELAETSNLIEPLTMAVLVAALDEAAAWRRSGDELRVAVNLAAQTLLDQRLAPRVAAMLSERGLPGSALRLEITERTLMRDVGRAAAVLEELGALGVCVSVDDFGTGYSSLALLRRLSVHEIKVDRSFVRDMAVNANDAAIVRSTVSLGRTLGLEVVAEGVETAEALGQLADLGCHTAQGYYISRPLPADAFRDWLEARLRSEALILGRAPAAA